jgi:pimeloyl-ACP methyl ester carboxylesterase
MKPSTIHAADGTALHLSDWPGTRPVVFVHAWGLSARQWDYQRAHLSELGHRTVAYDRRGHGRSADPGAGYDFDTLADDLARVLDTLDLCDVTLVAMSMGAGEAVRYLSRTGGERVARLVLVAPACTPYVAQAPDNPHGIPAELFAQFRRDVLMRDLPAWIDANADAFVTPETSPGMVAWIKAQMTEASLMALIACNRIGVETDFRADLARVAVPTLVVHGTADASAPIDLTGRPTAALVPGARLEVYEGAPHGLFVTHMARLNGDIAAFAAA